jgi:hypothetical protein
MAADSQTSKCPQCGKSFPANVRICPDDGTVLEHDTQASQLGTVLDGKYRLESFLSRGGMGAVYKATHVMLGKAVAVKLINPELVTSADVVRRFQREARAATALAHPNIVSVFDLGQTADGTLYIAMEYVDGRSLKAAISSGGAMAPTPAVAIMRQVVSALAVAHRHKIIHRDLKPQNIMLTRGADGQEIAKLVDFGIAKTFDEATQLTMAGDAIGTPHYMAPEQAAGKPVDARSDIYSAGIILYEMLSGEVPFNDTSAPAILIKHLQETPQAPSVRHAGVPPALDAIALKCLEKDPAQRYQTAEELGAALDHAVATLPPVSMQSQATMPMAAAGVPAMANAATAPMTVASAPPVVSGPAPTVRAQSAAAVPNAQGPADTRPTAAAAPSGSAAEARGVPAPAKSSKKPLAIVAAVFVIAIAAALAMQLRGGSGAPADSQQAAAPQTPAPAPAASPAMAPAPPTAPAAENPSPATAPPTASSSTTASPSITPSTAPAATVPTPSTSSRSSSGGTNVPARGASGATNMSGAQVPSTSVGSAVAAPAVAPQAAASAVAAFPANPSVAFQCSGAPEICSPLRSAMDDALEKAGLSSVRNAARADVSVTAAANIVGGQQSRQFGTNFLVNNYSIEVSGEATRSGESVPMPAARSVSFDTNVGAQRATETARLVASDVVDKIKAYAAKKH